MNFLSPYLFDVTSGTPYTFFIEVKGFWYKSLVFLKIENYPLPLPFSVLGNTWKLISNLFAMKELEYQFILLWSLSSLLKPPLSVGLLLHHKPSFILPILLFYNIFSIWLSDHHSIKLGIFIISGPRNTQYPGGNSVLNKCVNKFVVLAIICI